MPTKIVSLLFISSCFLLGTACNKKKSERKKSDPYGADNRDYDPNTNYVDTNPNQFNNQINGQACTSNSVGGGSKEVIVDEASMRMQINSINGSVRTDSRFYQLFVSNEKLSDKAIDLLTARNYRAQEVSSGFQQFNNGVNNTVSTSSESGHVAFTKKGNIWLLGVPYTSQDGGAVKEQNIKAFFRCF